MEKNEKTNVMRVLESKKIQYTPHHIELIEAVSGEEMAIRMGEDPDKVFKTLATQGASKNVYIFVVPVKKTLNLKKAAKAVKEKSIEMLKSKDLLSTVGYVHGSTSPIGTKKRFVTTFHETVNDHQTVIFSAGKIGYQVEISPSDLEKVIQFQIADITD